MNAVARMSGLGLLYAFSQPVTKSMPPAVTPSREDGPAALTVLHLLSQELFATATAVF